MLTFNLKKEWYEKIQCGEKDIEYRELKPYWNKRIYNEIAARFKQLFCCNYCSFDVFMSSLTVGNIILSGHVKMKCKLQLGYTKRHMVAIIKRIEIVNGKNTDLAIDKPVYAIYFANVNTLTSTNYGDCFSKSISSKIL